jgi:hypothetical protein
MNLNSPQFPNPLNVAKQAGKYVGNIVREVRDVPTAIGSTARAVAGKIANPNDVFAKQNFSGGIDNMKNQIKEVGGAAIGRIGSPSSTYEGGSLNSKGNSGYYSERKGAYKNRDGEAPQPTTNTLTGKTTPARSNRMGK